MTEVRDLIQRAIEIAGGSQERLAARLGCSQNAISKIVRSGHISTDMAARIDLATQGEIPKEALRPDRFPAPSRIPAPSAQDTAA